MKPSYLFGFDIGSTSINTVIIESDGKIIQVRYDYCHGKPFEKLREILDILEDTYSQEQFGQLSFTGTGCKLSLKSVNPPRIAGRCSVFAKSDMIHLQQIATPVHDIVAGLCFAVACNFISSLGRGKTICFPVMFQGGVSPPTSE